MVDWILGEFMGSSSVAQKKIGPKRGWPSGPVAQKKIGSKMGTVLRDSIEQKSFIFFTRARPCHSSELSIAHSWAQHYSYLKT